MVQAFNIDRDCIFCYNENYYNQYSGRKNDESGTNDISKPSVCEYVQVFSKDL